MNKNLNKNNHTQKLDEETLDKISAAGNSDYYKIGSVQISQGTGKDKKYFTVSYPRKGSGFRVVGVPDKYIEKLDDLKSRTAKIIGGGVSQDLIDKYNEATGDTETFSPDDYVK